MNADIPLYFPSVEEPNLKRDLERLASGVRAQQQQNERTFSANFATSSLVAADAFASFGQVTRLGPLRDTDLVRIQLPQPGSGNIGKQLGVQRANSLGCVYLVPPGALINGRIRLMLLGAKLLTTVTFDGENYYADNDGAAPWGGL